MIQSYILGYHNHYIRNVRKTDSGQVEKIMTVYKHDAARISDLDMARRVHRILKTDGEPWNIYRFNSLHGDLEEVKA